MKNLTLVLMGLTALSMGCKDDCDTGDTGADCKAEDDHADHDHDADADEGPPPEATFSVTWGADSIDAAVTNADMDAGYYFSLAQTGAGDAGWYGEDCITGACHELYDSLSLACVDTIDAVAASATTLHCDHEATTSWAFWGIGADGETYDDIVATGGENPGWFAEQM